jgi:chromate reductase
MHKTWDIVAIVGSLRRDSFTRRLVRSFDRLLPATVGIEIVGIGELPFYNQDMEASPPTAWTEFRKRIKRADAVLFATPEYNRSVPGVLKNAID